MATHRQRAIAGAQRGFTLVEVTIVLLTLTILASVMLPQLGNFNRLARFTKAREDVGALCAVAKTMLDVTLMSNFWDDPAGDTWLVAASDPVGLLWGPGEVPMAGIVGNNVVTQNVVAGNTWFEPSVMTYPCVTVAPDDGGGNVDFSCDELGNHLMANDPHMGFPYPNPLDDPRPPGVGPDMLAAYFGWRGPYFDAVTHDPWGNRYMINVFALYNGALFTSPTVCYSAGADERVDTVFNQPMDGDFEVGRDDIVAIMSAGGPF